MAGVGIKLQFAVTSPMGAAVSQDWAPTVPDQARPYSEVPRSLHTSKVAPGVSGT